MSFKKIMGTLSPAYGMATGEGLFGQAVGVLPMIAKDIRDDKKEDKERAAMEAAQTGRVPGMKKGGKISKAVMQNAGFYDKGKTEKERQDIVKKVTTKPQRVAMVAKAFLTKNMSHGGKISSASKRADGIALRGKTRA